MMTDTSITFIILIINSLSYSFPSRYYAQKLVEKLDAQRTDTKYCPSILSTWPFLIITLARVAVFMGVLYFTGASYKVMLIASFWLLMDNKIFMPFMEAYNRYARKGISKSWF